MIWRVDCSPVTWLETVRVCRMFMVWFGLVGLGLGKGREERVEAFKGCFAFSGRVAPAVGLGFPKVLGPFGDCGE